MKLWPCLLLSLLIIGCKHGPALHVTQAPDGVPPSGWTKLANADKGISVYAPGGWAIGAGTGMDLPTMSDFGDSGGSGMSAAMDKMAADQAKADEEAAKKLESKGIYLSVMNKSVKPIPGEERTRFTVTRVDKGGNASMDDVKDLVKKHGGNPVSVTLPIGPAFRGSGSETMRDGGVVTRICYGVADGSDVYLLEFITEEQPQAIEMIEKDVAASLRIAKKS